MASQTKQTDDGIVFDKSNVVDSFTVLTGGMNSGSDPVMLGSGQYSKGINVSCRGGMIHTRPAFVRENVDLPQGIWFQGAARWSTDDGDKIVVCCSGQLSIVGIEPGGDGKLPVQALGVFSDPQNQVFMCPVDRYFVVQDGVRTAVVEWNSESNAAVFVRAPYRTPEGADDVFLKGTVMHFCHGRLHQVPKYVPVVSNYKAEGGVLTELAFAESGSPGGRYLVSSDILIPTSPETVLRWKEQADASYGGARSLPVELGNIRGLASLRNAATGTGVGQLIVFAQDGVAAFDVSRPRQTTATVSGSNGDSVTINQLGWGMSAISQVLFFGGGMESPNAVANVNNDLVYRGSDGMRFLQYGVANGQSGSSSWALSNTPRSHEIDEFLKADTHSHLPYVSLVLADHRMLMTSVGRGPRTFSGLISMDTAINYNITQSSSQPPYDGLWTGLSFHHLVTAMKSSGKKVAYVFADGPTLYRIDDEVYRDNDTCSIESQMTTRSMFVASRFISKELKYVDLWLSGLRHNVDISVYYRPGKRAYWTQMGCTKQLKVAAGSNPQERSRLRFAPAAISADRTGQTFQFLIIWRGWAQIDRFLTVATPVGEIPPDCRCIELTPVMEIPGPGNLVSNDFSYEVT